MFKTAKLLMSALMAVALIGTAASAAAAPNINDYVTITPSTDRVYPVFKDRVNITFSSEISDLERNSSQVRLYGPDGNEITDYNTDNTYRINIKDDTTNDYHFYFDLPSDLTASGEYTFVIPVATFKYNPEGNVNFEYIHDGRYDDYIPEIRFTYQVGVEEHDYTVSPAEGEIDYFSSATFTYDANVSLTASAKAELVDAGGAVYPISLSASGNTVTATSTNGNIEVLGDFTLRIKAGSLVVGSATITEDVVAYYTIVGVEPVWNATVDPAYGVVSELKEFTITFNKYEVRHSTMSSSKDFPGIYKIGDDESLTLVARGYSCNMADGAYSEDTGDMTKGGRIFNFKVLPIEEAGTYCVIIPRSFLSFDGKCMHEDIRFGNWTIEPKQGVPEVTYTITPANGATVSKLNVVDFVFNDTEKLTWDEWGAGISTYWTGSNGVRTLIYTRTYGYGKDERTFRVTFGSDYGTMDPGLYEIELPAGFITVTTVDGETVKMGKITTKLTYEPGTPDYDGECVISQGDRMGRFIITFLPNATEATATSLKIQDTQVPITITNVAGVASDASNVSVNGVSATVDFDNLEDGQYYVTVPYGYFLVNNALSPKGIQYFTMTGVVSAMADGETADVYNANGVLVISCADKQALLNLPAGLYIVGDKKVLIK